MVLLCSLIIFVNSISELSIIMFFSDFVLTH